jgi:hypothetical protein
MRPEPVALSLHKLVVVRMLVMVVILTIVNDHHCLEQPDWWETSATAVLYHACVDLIFLFFEGMEAGWQDGDAG